MYPRRLFGLFIAAAAGACAVQPAPVPLSGPPRAIHMLEGEWQGEYEGRESGRAGSILFRITANADTAWGDVVMLARASSGVPVREPRVPAADEATVLKIAFVQIADGRIRGEMAEYHDPACGCALRTTFLGTVSGDVIEGTFTTVHQPDGIRQSGRWRVTRQRPYDPR